MDNGNEPATKRDLADLSGALKQDMADLENRLVEAIRDSETRVLKAFYSFVESNQQRLGQIENM